MTTDLPQTPSQRLRERLEAALAPTELVIRDDSALHAGHAGAREGGHYHLTIRSARFVGLAPVARHRLIYHAVGPLAPLGVHALAIDAAPPAAPAASMPAGPVAEPPPPPSRKPS